jgi:hypothetical protein
MKDITNSNGHELNPVPGEFAGMYRAGYEAGYASGREMGFKEGYAAVQQHSSAVTPVAGGKTASKPGPRRMLVGMPCPKCRIYLHTGDSTCPSCGLPQKDEMPVPRS